MCNRPAATLPLSRWALFLSGLLLLNGYAIAQVADPSTAARAPIPGSAHQYIGLGAETVNPADGLLSFDLPINTPPGRGLSFQFGIRYNSAEPYYVAGGAGNVSWRKSPPGVPNQFGGWSYELPAYTATAAVSSSYPDPSGSGTDYCDSSSNYVFRGFDGIQHNLSVTNSWPDPNKGLPNSCSQGGNLNGFGGHGTTASLANGGTGTQPPLTVTERNGTVYQFAQGPFAGGFSGNPSTVETWGMLAQTVTDRNGNQVVLNCTNSCRYLVTGNLVNPVLPAGSYTDTLGRTVVSWTGLGNTTSGDQLTVSGLSSITVHWANVTASLPGNAHPYPGLPSCSLAGTTATVRNVADIDLPDGQRYTFSYGGTYGRLIRITFPNGGYVRYVWGINANSALFSGQYFDSLGTPHTCTFTYDTVGITDRYISYDGSTEALHQQFTYSTSWPPTYNSGMFTTKTTTITVTDLLTGQVAVTNYTYADLAPWGVPVEQTIAYKDGSGTILKTVNKTWLNPFVTIGEQTVLDNGQGAATLHCYDSSHPDSDQVLAVYEYGFQSEGGKPSDPTCASSNGLNISAIGPLKRQTNIVNHSFGTTNILDSPDSVTVYDGSGNTVKQTTYTYTDTVAGSGTTVGLVAPPGANRGNIASIAKLVSPGNTITTSYTYFDNGNIQSMKDGCGNASCSDMTGANHTTTYSYTDNFTVGSAPGQTNAYLTQVTDPNTGAAHIEKFSWGYADGKIRSVTDQNNQATTFQYNDPLVRLTQVSAPDGGLTTVAYNDATFNATNNTPSFTATKLISSGVSQVTKTAMDGMGHTVRNMLTTDPNGTVYTDTTYDGFGRVRTVSNPYYTTGDPTYGITTYAYDALGRTRSVQHPDGATASASYTGRATLASDEGNGTRNVQRISQVDGLGRLTSVCEVTSTTLPVGSNPAPTSCGLDIAGTGFLTTYSYDTLDNLVSVSQGNLTHRTFAYDSLSRLLCSGNPEVSSAICPNPDNGSYTAGTNRYTYDANGNLASRKAPLPNQTSTSTTVTTSHTYDVLNRTTSTYYNDGVTPSNYFAYDQSSIWGYTLNNTIGRMTSESRTVAGQNSQYIFSYDPMGRTAFQRRCLPINCGGSPGSYLLAYTYDLAGNVTSASNGMGVTISYGPYNGANELTTVTSSLSDATHPGTLMSVQQYGALGKFMTAAVGNSAMYEHFSYSKRGFPTSFWACTVSGSCDSNTLLYTYAVQGLAPNGNILNVVDTVNGTWTYTYDDFNRLSTAVATNGRGCSWDYDRFGNRWHQKTYNGSCTTPTFSSTGNNNRIDGYSYDAAGNLLNDGVHNYTYDAENRIWKVDGGSTATYVYDAQGQRIQKTSGSTAVDYLYDTAGHQITELSSTGSWNRGEIYAAGLHLATYRNNTTYFNFSDWLGTERSRSTLTGAVCETTTSLPFGDNQVTSGSCIGISPMHLTGKERDSESGLDNFGARYNASTLGRFMTPDPVHILKQKLVDPQQWNMYAYVRNNPLRFVDPTGKWLELTGDDEARRRQLSALQQAVGKQAGQYLYDNAVTTTDANGNKTTKHYLGIRDGGPDGKGPSFGSINAAANKLGGIVQDTHRGAMIVLDNPSAPRSMVGSLNQGMSPGRTPVGSDWAVIHVTSGEIGTQRSELQSDGQAYSPTLGDVLSHELGHVDATWYHGAIIPYEAGDPISDGDAVRMENQSRQLNAEPLRTGHSAPGDVPLTGVPY